jgi:two-component system sensor histidine kinase BarA
MFCLGQNTSLQSITSLLNRIGRGESVDIATDSGGELGRLQESVQELATIMKVPPDGLRYDLEETTQEYKETRDTTDAMELSNTGDDPLGYTNIRVLAVDDNEANLKLVCALLDDLGVDARKASSGHDAVELARKTRFDLIFMDVQMPAMDGLEATEKIHANETGEQHTPVVALTAHMLADEIDQLLNSGMDDYIVKPINELYLRSMLLKWVRFDHSIAAKPAARVVDWELAYRLAGGKKELAEEMLSLLLSTMPGDVAEIKTAYDSYNLQSMKDAVHRLHGAIRYCGVPTLHGVVKNLETMLKQDRRDGLDDAVNQLYDEVGSLQNWAAANNRSSSLAQNNS